MKEEKLAEWTISWLEAQNWEIYQEVQIFSYGHVADIIAKQNKLIWVVECKLSLSLAVIEQAMEWKRLAHFVSISTLYPRASRKGRRAAKIFLRDQGIGLIEFDRIEYPRRVVIKSNVVIKPRLNRKAFTHHINLTDRHKTWAKAGNADCDHWTPYQETCRDVSRIVKENPGITLKQIIEKLTKHHYASDQTARSCLLHWAKKGKIAGVRIDKDGKQWRFYSC